jgi:hypothetical protein
VPAEEGIGLDIDQGVTPREHAAQNHHNQSRGIMGPGCFQLALLKQRELFAQIEVLGCQCAARPRTEHEEANEIVRDGRQRGEAVYQRSEDGAGHERLVLHVTRRYVTANWRERGFCGLQVYAPSDSSTGYLLFLREGTLMAQVFDSGSLELTGEPVAVAQQVGSSNTYGHFAVSANGVLAYRNGGSASGTQLTWFDRQRKVLGVPSERAGYNTVALSADGTRAAVSRSASVGLSYDLWLHEFPRGTSTRFTSDSANEDMAVWSPDGSRIAFSSNRDQYYNLYLKGSSGAGNESELLKSSEHKYAYDWSSDGVSSCTV